MSDHQRQPFATGCAVRNSLAPTREGERDINALHVNVQTDKQLVSTKPPIVSRPQIIVHSITVIVIVVGLTLLSGCSAVVFGTSTPEVELINSGTTKSHLVRKLGRPVSETRLAHGPLMTDLQRTDESIISLLPAEYLFDPEAAYRRVPAKVEVSSTAVFIFKGRIGGDHLSGESVSLNLMTLGLAEIFLLPAAIKDRATREPLELTVWFDQSDRVVAYKWRDSAEKK